MPGCGTGVFACDATDGATRLRHAGQVDTALTFMSSATEGTSVALADRVDRVAIMPDPLSNPHPSPPMIPFPLRASRRSRASSTLLTVGALLILAMPAAAQSPASALRVTPAQFRDLRWLEGTWRGRMSNGKYFYERYERVNDSTIRIIHFA